MPKLFTAEELEIMDSLTANNPVVLASLGGKPTMPGEVRERDSEATGTSESERTGYPQRRHSIAIDEGKAQLESGDQAYPRQRAGKMV